MPLMLPLRMQEPQVWTIFRSGKAKRELSRGSIITIALTTGKLIMMGRFL
jgi:hypothetical protein